MLTPLVKHSYAQYNLQLVGSEISSLCIYYANNKLLSRKLQYKLQILAKVKYVGKSCKIHNRHSVSIFEGRVC